MNLSQPEHSKKNLVIISGPTAVGKTSVAVKIAQHFHTEIISADSRQLYREIKIGTAVPSDDELAAVKHHMIGTLSIHDSYNAYRFETDVIKLLNNLFLHKKTVIMAGGSGLYIDAVCNGIDVIPDPDPELRIQLNRAFDEKGITPLRNQLKLLDPEYYASADIANHKRIIRALEVCISTGKPYSACLKKNKAPRDFHVIKIGLNRTRNELNSRINERVDMMISKGLLEEAKQLYSYKTLNSLNTVGYRELFRYCNGQYSFDEAIEKIKTNTRRYAKKQITWFMRDKNIKWFHPDDTAGILEFINSKMHMGKE